MSDTATNGSLDAFLLDGDAPRLGSAAPIVPAPAVLDHEVRMPPPVADGLLPAPGFGAEPVLLGLGGPTLPTAAPKPPAGAPTAGDAPETAGAAPAHPMAHLMPAKAQPNETSAWAAEIRAKKKAKARRTKIIAAVIALAVTAAVGPPLGKWLVNAINESGSTKSDEPAPAPTTVPAATATTAPAAATATTAPGGLLGLPGQAQEAVAGVNEVEINEVEVTAAPVAPAPTAAPAAP